jgi:hypothetical protein
VLELELLLVSVRGAVGDWTRYVQLVSGSPMWDCESRVLYQHTPTVWVQCLSGQSVVLHSLCGPGSGVSVVICCSVVGRQCGWLLPPLELVYGWGILFGCHP